jgi:hypothetical protein
MTGFETLRGLLLRGLLLLRGIFLLPNIQEKRVVQFFAQLETCILIGKIMEAAALGVLASLGYVVSRFAGGNKKTEKFADMPNQPQPLKPGSETVALRAPPYSPMSKTPQGASARGQNPELDLFYQNPSGQFIPSEPSPGPYGMPLGYATQNESYNPDFAPGPMPIEDATSQVRMNHAGFEADPTYIDGDFVSSLSGERIKADEFKHSNMQPYFGGSVKQNVRDTANYSVLDRYTGSGSTSVKKTEVENMFDYNQPFGNPYGLESATDFIESRMEVSRNRAGERPFEPTRVGAGVGDGYGSTGKGGFQQFEINEIMRQAMPTTDKLRTANNPKNTYKGQVVPGQHYIGKGAEDAGEVRKYRPDRFYTDESNSRVFVGPATVVKETARPVQILPNTARMETSKELFGSAAGQDEFSPYVTGSYRTPMTQQYGGAGYRNANMTEYFTENTDVETSDYGRHSIENRPNERSATGTRTMALNLMPVEAGQTAIHYEDDARPTRREEMENNSREIGMATGYAGGAPAVTVWDPNDVARTTVKETTIDRNYMGIMTTAAMPNKLKVYDPLDIAKPTKKAELSASMSWYGTGGDARKSMLVEDGAYNMRTNPNKEKIAKGRKPIAGNGKLALSNNFIRQTAKRPVSDDVNERLNSANRVSSIPTGVGDIGQVRYRAPLQLDVSAERLTSAMVDSVVQNPLQQSIHMNANKSYRDVEFY